MVICFTHDQAILLSQMDSVEIDMSFKRVKAKEMKEVVFAKYVASQSKGKLLSASIKAAFKHLLSTPFY